MSETDRLRDLLEQAAPARPDLDPTMRAAAVARRGRAARTRDRALVAAAAVAVLAIAVPLALRGNPAHEPTPAPAPSHVEPCPAGRVDTTTLGPVSGLGDAVVVRSCPVRHPGSTYLSPEPLVGAAARSFAEDVAALAPYQLTCENPPDNPSAPWALQVQTEDGELFTIGNPEPGCSVVRIDGTDRGVADMIAVFEGNAARQQAGGPPELGCPIGPSLLPDADQTWHASFDPATATAGIVCYRPGSSGAREYADIQGELSADELAAVRDDLAANIEDTDPETGGCTVTGHELLLVLQDAEGDQVAYLEHECAGALRSARGYWTPGPAASEAIAAALGGAVN